MRQGHGALVAPHWQPPQSLLTRRERALQGAVPLLAPPLRRVAAHAQVPNLHHAAVPYEQVARLEVSAWRQRQ